MSASPAIFKYSSIPQFRNVHQHHDFAMSVSPNIWSVLNVKAGRIDIPLAAIVKYSNISRLRFNTTTTAGKLKIRWKTFPGYPWFLTFAIYFHCNMVCIKIIHHLTTKSAFPLNLTDKWLTRSCWIWAPDYPVCGGQRALRRMRVLLRCHR